MDSVFQEQSEIETDGETSGFCEASAEKSQGDAEEFQGDDDAEIGVAELDEEP